MRTLSEEDRRACLFQAQVFEASCEETASGSAIFIRRFMHSAVARRFDVAGIQGETESPAEIVREVETEYGSSPYGSTRFSADELYWMGYMYRAWCISAGISSKVAYTQVSARDLRKLFAPYHSLDVLDAIGRIREAKGISQDDINVRGLELLRRMRSLDTGGDLLD
ncbi:antitoxin [Coriobacteriales bacterium OH1046]|nr:antitoxin [Coriobacteriales bacterium OH1046]